MSIIRKGIKKEFLLIFFVTVFVSGALYSASHEELRMTFDMSEAGKGVSAGWRGSRGGGFEDFSYDSDTGVASFTLKSNWRGMTTQVELVPGHYVLRALAKTNSFAVKLHADRLPLQESCIFTVAIGVSDEFREVFLPFFVEGAFPDKKQYQVGLARVYQDPAMHEAIVHVKAMEIIRLGDTALRDNWLSEAPADIIHGLKTLERISSAERPGKVIFNDSMIGTEIWLMTQGGEVNLTYAGFPNFSLDGRYVCAGMRTPGDVLATDGSYRYRNPLPGGRGSWTGQILWLFLWEEKRLPPGSNPSDWICPVRTFEYVEFLNLETGDVYRFDFPSNPGWRIIHYPSMSSHGSRGPDIRNITYELLVWRSEDGRKLGLSDIEGGGFRSFNIKSISLQPAKDRVYPLESEARGTLAMNSAWGKAGQNWINAVDREGIRYYAFEINRNNFFSDDNPYQVWMLPLCLDDERGLLRAVPNPAAQQIPHEGLAWEGDTWWNLAGGLPRSGDNASILLEDGTFVHMSSLGMHSNFRNTVSVNCPYENSVRFIGSYPDLDHVSWPHEFRRDRDFATVWSGVVPPVPFIMIDLENDTLWTVAMKNSYDRAKRAEASRRLAREGAPGSGRVPARIIWPMANPSPDFTKVLYASSMLTVERPGHELGDAYIAVARYPEPPLNLFESGGRLSWEPPEYSAEIKGYNLFRSAESGRGFEKVNAELITGLSHDITQYGKGVYVMTSVEHSGLESRRFSMEKALGVEGLYRHFYEAEQGRLTSPMVPFFEPAGASDGYAVAVTDPELLYRERLQKGMKGKTVIDAKIPAEGALRIVLRVRGMSLLERSSYTFGWGEEGEPGNGVFTVKVNGSEVGKARVEGYGWHWKELDGGAFRFEGGLAEIEVSTSDAGIALDNILVTNDMEFVPEGKSNVPEEGPGYPRRLRAEGLKVSGDAKEFGGYRITPPYLNLVWEKPVSVQGVRYYNIYRSGEPGFEVSPATLFGSSLREEFIDNILEEGGVYYYRVAAFDSWGNSSIPSEEVEVRVKE